MHLGQTESGAAAHFPQATSEGNTPPGPLSSAKPRLQAQGRVAGLGRWCHENFMWPTNTDSSCQQARQGRKDQQWRPMCQMKPCPQHCGTVTMGWWCSCLAAPSNLRAGTSPSWPPWLLFSWSSKKLSSYSVLRGAETTFSKELKCQEDTRKPGWSLSQQEGGCYSSNLLW